MAQAHGRRDPRLDPEAVPGPWQYVRLLDGLEAEPGPEGVGLRRGFAKGVEARLLQNRWVAPVVDDVPRFQ